jgi:putative membrane protein
MTIYSAALILADQGHMDGFAWWMIPMMVAMMVGMILFLGLVILGVIWLVRGGLGPREDKKVNAVELLERRLAEGDLTVEEYRERRAVLAGPPDAES